MEGRDFLATNDGSYQVFQPPREWNLLRNSYYFHRFLTEVEDAIENVEEESIALPKLRLLVRQLIVNSYWIRTQAPEPSHKTGISTRLLYDEIGYPLTVQLVSCLPEVKSSIHNHGTWGIVVVLEGKEINTLWRRVPDVEFRDRIEPTCEITLLPGDIIGFTPDAIHSIQSKGEGTTVTFNLYGETHHLQRYEFDAIAHTAKNF